MAELTNMKYKFLRIITLNHTGMDYLRRMTLAEMCVFH